MKHNVFVKVARPVSLRGRSSEIQKVVKKHVKHNVFVKVARPVSLRGRSPESQKVDKKHPTHSVFVKAARRKWSARKAPRGVQRSNEYSKSM